MLWFRRKPKRVNLALQGGGAHGAFTWGVLDQLLLDEMTAVGWVSGTSAGALNAVALAHGLAAGGRQAARETLEAVWGEVEAAGVPDFLSLNPLLLNFTRAAPMTNLNGLLSPYSFNPLGFDPLRTILEKHIDFDAIRRSASVRVSVAATDVATGKARLFSREAVLASACLPTLHHAVMIEGRAYWDGGFSANPDVLSLALESPVKDTMIVLLNPLLAPVVPRTAREIEDRVNTITFNQPLLRDIDTIVRAKTMQSGWFAPRQATQARLKRHRFHLIEAGAHTSELGAETKVIPDRAVLRQLYMAGVLEAERWLGQHARFLGRRGTVSLQDHFSGEASGAMAEPVVVPEDAGRLKRSA
jgi:NTE family protein